MFGRVAASIFGGFLVAQLGATALFAAIALSGKGALVGDLIHPSASAIFLWSILAVFLWFIGPLVAMNASTSWAAWRQLCIVAALFAFALAVLGFVAAGLETNLASIQSVYSEIFSGFSSQNPGALLRDLPALGRTKLLQASIPVCLLIALFLLIAGLLSGRDPVDGAHRH